MKIPKRSRNAIIARLENTVSKYGYEHTRSVISAYFRNRQEQNKLKRTIEDKSKELSALKKRVR